MSSYVIRLPFDSSSGLWEKRQTDAGDELSAPSEGGPEPASRFSFITSD